MKAWAASAGETMVVRRSAARRRTINGVMSESPEAITNSSYLVGATSASIASSTIRMSAAFFERCVRDGQSTTSNPARVNDARKREK